MMKYPIRHIASIIIEALTPIAPGSGEKSIISDSVVATDYNGLPYIPATSLAGVIRNLCGLTPDCKDSVFGTTDSVGQPHGSRLIISEARLIDLDGTVIDGITRKPCTETLKNLYSCLPVRQHVKISARGTHENNATFNNQIVYRGSRFMFEMELMSDDANDDVNKGNPDVMAELLRTVTRNDFRIGGGTRKGYGKVAVIKARHKKLDLRNNDDMSLYLKKTSSMNDGWDAWEMTAGKQDEAQHKGWKSYCLKLVPADMFMFGTGYADSDADNSQIKEKYIVWNEDKGIVRQGIVIPASSVKGAIAHRTAFHYNCLKENFINKQKEGIDPLHAVKVLFGYSDSDTQTIGHVIFDDIVQDFDTIAEKVNNHVKIDRFTGGAYPGALYNEKAIYGNNISFDLTYHIDHEAFKEQEKEVLLALDKAIDDLCSGNLPLGGAVNRGLGVFNGIRNEI